MSHFQRGYAVVEFEYTFDVQRVDNTRAKTYDDQGQWIETENLQQKVPIQAERRGKYYAECKKNETHDAALSKWVKYIAMPQAVQEITAVINKRNEEARERKRNWEDEQRKRVNKKLQSKVEEIKPREVVYLPFDGRRLAMGSPRVVPNAPEEGDGERLGWIS